MKARMAEVRTLVKNVSDATQIYLLIHDKFPTKFEELDIQIPHISDSFGGSRNNLMIKNNVMLSLDSMNGSGLGSCAHVSGYVGGTGITSRIGKKLPVYCYAYTYNPQAIKMCSSFGPKIPCESCVAGGDSSIYCYSME